MYRTLYCNDICDKHIGQTVQLAGWVDVVRDHGGVIFVDIRDYTGVTQVVIHNEELVKNVNRETVISVTGTVEKRDPDTVNEKIATGYVELVATALQYFYKDTVIARLTGDGMADDLLAPDWSRKKVAVINDIDKYLFEHDMWQGKLFEQL